MPGYVQLGDVRTYYEEDGAGEPLVLLHPGLADSRAFEEYVPELARMHREEPTLTVADLAGYPGPTLVMVGDSDEEIPIEHTLALRRGLPNAQLAVLPGTGHGGIDSRTVIRFLTDGGMHDRPGTARGGPVMLPFRRAVTAGGQPDGAAGFEQPHPARDRGRGELRCVPALDHPRWGRGRSRRLHRWPFRAAGRGRRGDRHRLLPAAAGLAGVVGDPGCPTPRPGMGPGRGGRGARRRWRWPSGIRSRPCTTS